MERNDAELMRLVLDQLPDGIVIAGTDGRVLLVNDAARRITGRHERNALAFPMLFADAVPDDVERGVDAVRSGTVSEFSFAEGDASSGRVYQNVCIPVLGPDGSYAGTALVARDVTERQLQDARHQATVSGLEQQVADLQAALQEHFVDGMIALVDALEARDRYTCGHSGRVAVVAGRLAQRVIGRAAECAEIQLAARLHDIGKVAVPDSLLDKPSSLTEAEIEVMDTHPIVGESILRPIVELRGVACIIRSHHERWDGTGYPDGLAGTRIPIGSRVLALADTWDAMTSERPYRSSLSVSQARGEVAAHLGSQFDPIIGTVFLELVDSGEVTAVPEADARMR